MINDEFAINTSLIIHTSLLFLTYFLIKKKHTVPI
jgi:hypothetical protein